MSKKKIIELKFGGKENSKKMGEVFIDSLHQDSIYVRNDKLYMELSSEIYTIDFELFKMIWKENFEVSFEDISQMFCIENKFEDVSVPFLYNWINPILSKFEIEKREEFIKNYKRKLQKNQEYRSRVKTIICDYIETLETSKRKTYIDRFMQFDLFNENERIKLGYYLKYSPEELKRVFEEKDLSSEQQFEIIALSIINELENQEKTKIKDKRGYNSKILKLYDLLPASEIVRGFSMDAMSVEEFIRTKVKKQDILSAPFDILFKILSEKNSDFPKILKITSMDLVNQYGRLYDGNIVYKLANAGYIEPQDLIIVYDVNKVLERIDYDGSVFEDEELQAFYTPYRLLEMKEHQVLTMDFIEKYLELQDFKNNPEKFKIKSKMLIDELKRKYNEENKTEYQDAVLDFYNLGLCDVEIASKEISEEYIENKFLNNEISIEDIFEYYEKGLVTDEAISKYFDKDDILSLYEEGKLNGRCLFSIKDADYLIQAFCENRITINDFAKLFLESSCISISDFDDGLKLAEQDVDISYLINEKTPFIKIKELLSRNLIPFSSIKTLHNQGIINDSELDELILVIDKSKLYTDLKNGKIFKIITNRENNSSPRTRTTHTEKKEKDFSDEIALISTILEKDAERGVIPMLDSYNVSGKPTSLNKYRIFFNEELDGIIILQKSKKGNAVFVMSDLQLVYFLNERENSQGELEIRDRMIDKAHLRTIEGVEVVEHSLHFARNLIEASARISPKVAKRLKRDDGKYIKDVDKMVNDMRQKYIDSREQGDN